MKKQKEKPELKVVLDTNIIYSGSANFLINEQVSEFVKTNKDFYDLKISWYLPEIVVKERTFQMINKAKELLPSIHKLEALLGHNLNITEDIIISRVTQSVDKHIDSHAIQIIKIDVNEIDWNRLINDSIFKIPPFEVGAKEKGFKDSLILESFDQLIKKSPKTSKVCKIVFVCADNLLIEAAEKRIHNSNVRFVNDLNELKGLINVLVSEIEEGLVKEISATASELFFIPENMDTLFYKENLRNRVLDLYRPKIYAKFDDVVTKVSPGTWYISPVNFVKKEKQRIFWSSSIKIDLISFKNEYKPKLSTRVLANPMNAISNFGIGLSEKDNNYSRNRLLSNDYSRQSYNQIEETEYLKGKSKIEIVWSITYQTNKKFSTPKIEEIKFIETNWNNED